MKSFSSGRSPKASSDLGIGSVSIEEKLKGKPGKLGDIPKKKRAEIERLVYILCKKTRERSASEKRNWVAVGFVRRVVAGRGLVGRRGREGRGLVGRRRREGTGAEAPFHHHRNLQKKRGTRCSVFYHPFLLGDDSRAESKQHARV